MTEVTQSLDGIERKLRQLNEVVFSDEQVSAIVDNYKTGKETSLRLVIKKILENQEPLYNTFESLWTQVQEYVPSEQRKLWSVQIDTFLNAYKDRAFLAGTPSLVKLLTQLREATSRIDAISPHLIDEQYERLTREVTSVETFVDGSKQTTILGVPTFTAETSVEKKQEVIRAVMKPVLEKTPKPTLAIYIIGGAAKTGTQEYDSTEPIVTKALEKVFSAGRQVVVIDGLTDSGYVAMPSKALGAVGAENRKNVSHIGTAPGENANVISAPHARNRYPAADKEQFRQGNHYDVAIPVYNPSEKHGPYGQWGGETEDMGEMATAVGEEVAKNDGHEVVIMMGGGGISLNELLMHLRASRKILALDGSGRGANEVSILDYLKQEDRANLSEGQIKLETKLAEANTQWRALFIPIKTTDPSAVEILVKGMEDPAIDAQALAVPA